jgi:ABC-type uncharacterized transport system auxiliary subunit
MKWMVYALLSLLTACSVTTPRDVGNHNILTLTPLPAEGYVTKKHGALLLDYPTAVPELDTPRVSVIRADDRQDYFASTKWSDFLPVVTQSVLLESLRNQGYFAYAEPESSDITRSFLLRTRINQFTAIYAKADMPPVIHLSLSFELKRTGGRGGVTAFTITRSVPATRNTTSSVAAAFTQALQAVARELLWEINE